jgi:putative phosphoribosyl transferase
MKFDDRVDAGRELVRAVRTVLRKDEDALVLGLARGGVVVAAEVARTLGCPLDVVVVRKIAHPSSQELAIGAVGENDTVAVAQGAAGGYHVPPKYVADQVSRAREIIAHRLREYRREVRPDLRGKTAVLVDDGIVTGHTVEAAIRTVRQWGAARVIIAVPVAPRATAARLRHLVDELVVLDTPEILFTVGEFYKTFGQVEDEEIRTILAEANSAAV